MKSFLFILLVWFVALKSLNAKEEWLPPEEAFKLKLKGFGVVKDVSEKLFKPIQYNSLSNDDKKIAYDINRESLSARYFKIDDVGLIASIVDEKHNEATYFLKANQPKQLILSSFVNQIVRCPDTDKYKYYFCRSRKNHSLPCSEIYLAIYNIKKSKWSSNLEMSSFIAEFDIVGYTKLGIVVRFSIIDQETGEGDYIYFIANNTGVFEYVKEE